MLMKVIYFRGVSLAEGFGGIHPEPALTRNHELPRPVA